MTPVSHPFSQVYYDKRDHNMRLPDASREDDFISISGSKMRKLAAIGAKACPSKIPSDLIAAKCIPPGFMVEKGWDIVSDYYIRQKTVRASPHAMHAHRHPACPLHTASGSSALSLLLPLAPLAPLLSLLSLLSSPPPLAPPRPPSLLAQGDWVPYSKQLGGIPIADGCRSTAETPFGHKSFAVTFMSPDKVTPLSPWHDLPLGAPLRRHAKTTARTHLSSRLI